MSHHPKFEAKDTASSLLVLNHYAELGVAYGWDRDRVIKLCNLLTVTPVELSRLCCMFSAPVKGEKPNFSMFSTWWSDNHFPPCAALHFAILESWILEVLSARRGQHIEQKPIMPVDLIVKPAETRIHLHD